MEGMVFLEDLRIHCILGVYPYERNIIQEISVDVEMKLNLAEAVRNDSLVDTVNYELVSSTLKELAETRKYNLVETFAYEAVHAILDTFPLTWAKVRVRKSHAPLTARCGGAEFEKAK